ncbi:hypothetical protein FJZ36_07555 [Candidatus Poribacteria bacterium]|nr:hypothetical protein [Candidatus Poribacteria bacterium]
MTKPAFVLSVREHGNELLRAECASLARCEPDADGFASSHGSVDIARAAYLRVAADVVASDDTFDGLLNRVRRARAGASEFRIDAVTLPGTERRLTREDVIAAADAFEGFYPNLRDPKSRFLLVSRQGCVLLGAVRSEPDRSYERHDAKPYRTSSSLPSRLARAVVNVVAGPGDTVVDPCSGTGSLLLEACAIGALAIGSDWNPRMVGMTRANLAHFGYEGEIALADARAARHAADAVATDLPYGRNLVAPEGMLREIIANCARTAPRAAFVALADITGWLADAGYEDIRVYRVPKYTGFVRYVHVARSSRPTLR